MPGDRLVPGVQHRQQAAEAAAVAPEQVLDELDDPGMVEPVAAPGAAVLIGLPAHQRAQVRVVGLVDLEPERPGLALELAHLPAQVAVQARGPSPQLLRVGGIAVPQVDDRRGRRGGLVPPERLLAADQVIEVPDREAGAAQQRRGVPPRAGIEHQPLAVGQTGTDRPSHPEPALLEREEPSQPAVIADHGHSGVLAGLADGDGELRAQERVAQFLAASLQVMPGTELAVAKLGRMYHRYLHSCPLMPVQPVSADAAG
jgi:hypothetical protein